MRLRMQVSEQQGDAAGGSTVDADFITGRLAPCRYKFVERRLYSSLIPRDLIREFSVVGFTPSNAAAPSAP